MQSITCLTARDGDLLAVRDDQPAAERLNAAVSIIASTVELLEQCEGPFPEILARQLDVGRALVESAIPIPAT